MPDTAPPSLLAQADACHDDDPATAAQLMRQIEPAGLAPGDRPRLAFLFNHVLGEKLGDWAEAHRRQQTLLAVAGDAPGIVLLRHAGAAAALAHDAAAQARCVGALQAASGSAQATAEALVGAAAAVFALPALGAAEAGTTALAAGAPFDAVHAEPCAALDAAFAVVANNLASDLAERPLADLQEPVLRDALARLADHAQRFWQRAGSWVNHERAHYLCALAANALGDAAGAADAARAGLALLDRHDAEHAEDVDRAFLEQELAAALHGQSEGAAAQARADTLAAGFDADLTAWYRRRAERNAALLAARGG